MIRHCILIAALAALAGCSDEGKDAEVVESETASTTAADAAEINASDRSLTNPAQDSVTAPAGPPARPKGEGAVTPRDMEEQYQDYVEDQTG